MTTNIEQDIIDDAKELLGKKCIDGGTCHHNCSLLCFRRECCSALTGYTGTWNYDHFTIWWQNLSDEAKEYYNKSDAMKAFNAGFRAALKLEREHQDSSEAVKLYQKIRKQGDEITELKIKCTALESQIVNLKGVV